MSPLAGIWRAPRSAMNGHDGRVPAATLRRQVAVATCQQRTQLLGLRVVVIHQSCQLGQLRAQHPQLRAERSQGVLLRQATTCAAPAV